MRLVPYNLCCKKKKAEILAGKNTLLREEQIRNGGP